MSEAEDIVLAFDEGAFTKVNKKLLIYVGAGIPAILFGELVGLHKMNKNSGYLEPDNAFHCPIKLFQRQLGIPAAKQQRAFRFLEEKGLIHTSSRGFPAARYIKINFETMLNVFASADQLAQLESFKKETFYEKLNQGLRLALDASIKDPFPALDQVFDKMRSDVRGVITLISQSWIQLTQKPLHWDSKLAGQIINWTRNRTTGKVLDFSLVTRTIDTDITQHGFGFPTFEKFVTAFLWNSKTTPEVHYSEQKYSYKELILKGR